MSTLSADSRTLSPLPPVLSRGLIPVAFFGFLSFFFSISLFFFLTYRLISWRRKSGSQATTNQFLVLIYNLVLADIQQSMAFLLNVSSLREDALLVGTRTCWAQGWFVSTGDLASSVFIFIIALHTFLAVVRGYKLPGVWFYTVIATGWAFVYVLAVAGAAMHPDDLYVRAGAWCWINGSYQAERLYLHYLWIFVCMFSTILIYTFIYLHLRARAVSSSQPIPQGATPLMILYPTIYTVCTIPLAAGRIATMAGSTPDLTYFCIAGSMIACNGWLDVLLYSLTRRSIVFSDVPPGEDFGIQTFWGPGKPRMGNVTTIEGGVTPHSASTSHPRAARVSSSASTENLYGMSLGIIKVDQSVAVRREIVGVEEADHEGYEMQLARERTHGHGKMESRERIDKASWETRSVEDF